MSFTSKKVNLVLPLIGSYVVHKPKDSGVVFSMVMHRLSVL